MKTEKEVRQEVERLAEWYRSLTARERLDFERVYQARLDALEWVLGKETT